MSVCDILGIKVCFLLELFRKKVKSRVPPRASLMAQWLRTACNAGDPGSIPGWGRSPGEVNGTLVFLPGESHGQVSQAAVHGVAK